MSKKRKQLATDESDLRQIVKQLETRSNQVLTTRDFSLSLEAPHDVLENEPTSQGFLCRGYIEFDREQDFVTIDLRSDDLERQLVDELRRIGGIYQTVVSDLASGLS